MAAIPWFDDPSRERREADPAAVAAAAAEALTGVQASIAGLTDSALVAVAAEVESLARRVQAVQARVAGEADSRSPRGAEGLAQRHGCRSAMELLERLTQAPPDELNQRVRVDRATRATVTLLGEVLPAPHPEIAQGLERAAIGIAAADHLRGVLDRVAHRALPDRLAVAEAELVAAASDTGARWTYAQLKQQAATWAAFLDEDGPAPDAAQASRRRGVSIRLTPDGLHRIHGDLMPEVGAQLQRLFDAANNPAVRFSDHPEDQPAGEPWSDAEQVADPRTAAQRRHDILAAALMAAARSTELPSLGGAAPTLLVHVALEDLRTPSGVATIDGIDLSLPADLAHRIACTGAVQKIVFDRNGRLVCLGSKERVFNAHQRRAITARDGGCVIPGCTIPAAWCEIHHVTDHAQGGPTHTDNGVLLCWWHHHHLDASGWRIRMNRGVPEVAAPPWIDHRGIYRPAPCAVVRARARGRARPPAVPRR